MELNKAEGFQKMLSEQTEKLIKGEIDIEQAKAIAKMSLAKIGLYREQLKYKKLTGKPTEVKFFE